MTDLKNFSESAKKILLLAQEEARRLEHNFIGRELILVGLLATDNGAARLLKAAGVTLEAARAEVETIIGRGLGFVAHEISYTPIARSLLEQAASIPHSQQMQVQPEHILLAITNSPPGIVIGVLENLGVVVEQLRKVILAQLYTFPQQQPLQSDAEFEFPTRIAPTIPPINRTAPTMINVTVLSQESGRWVAQVRAGGIGLDNPGFTSLAYGDTDFLAIGEALEGLGRMYRDYRA